MADFSINDVTRRTQFVNNTGLGPFAFTFEIFTETDIAVYKNTTLLTLTTDYTVTINANGTGSITLTGSGNGTALITTDILTIVGARNLERTTDFVTGGDLLASSLNEQLDSQVIMVQQLDEKLARSIRFDSFDQFTDATMPAKADRLGKYLQFNSTTGDPEAGPNSADVTTLADVATDIATLADIEDGTDATDAIQTVAGISSNVSTVAGISSNVTSVAGNATNINTVAADGTDIGTVATNIANVNTTATNISDVNTVVTNLAAIQDAPTQATNAANSATASANSATASANSATASASSATSAASAQTAAETARDQTLTAFDDFDDRYLGQKASDPTLDNDGDALVAGALYFNTTDDVMKVYEGSTWVAAYASLSGALLTANNLSDLADASAARTNLGLGTAATTASTDYATAAQGTKADSALQDVVDDITPQLGGNLDLNTSDVTGTGDINITGSVTATSFSGDGSSLTGIASDVVDDTTPQLGGDLDLNSNDITGTGNLSFTGNVTASATSTETRFFDIGVGRTGNGASYADFVGDTTYTDYGLRVLRAGGGANTTSQIIHRGTGDLRIQTTDAGSIKFRTSNTERAGISSTGDFSFNSGYGSAATAYGVRAWIATSGTATTIDGSGNIASISRTNVGVYRIYFDVDMPDTNYAVLCSADDGANPIDINIQSKFTGSCIVNMHEGDANSSEDVTDIFLAIVR